MDDDDDDDDDGADADDADIDDDDSGGKASVLFIKGRGGAIIKYKLLYFELKLHVTHIQILTFEISLRLHRIFYQVDDNYLSVLNTNL